MNVCFSPQVSHPTPMLLCLRYKNTHKLDYLSFKDQLPLAEDLFGVIAFLCLKNGRCGPLSSTCHQSGYLEGIAAD